MDLEDNETAMTSHDTLVEELKGTNESLEAQLVQNQNLISDMEAKLEESKAQVWKKKRKFLKAGYILIVCQLKTLKMFHLFWRDNSNYACIKSYLPTGLCLGNPVGGGPVPKLCVGVSIRNSQRGVDGEEL